MESSIRIRMMRKVRSKLPRIFGGRSAKKGEKFQMAKVYAFVADGMEEVECLAVCDCLRRAKVDVKLVSIMGRKMVTGSHGFKIEADCLFEEIEDDADVLFLPGGLVGTNNLKSAQGTGRDAESPCSSRKTSGCDLRSTEYLRRAWSRERPPRYMLSGL